MSESAYPYVHQQGKCAYNSKNTTGVKNTGY